MKAFTVEHYLEFAKKRIESTIQYETARQSLDFTFIKSEVRSKALREQETYDDSHGTGGFMKWINLLIYKVCDYYKNHNTEYLSKLSAFGEYRSSVNLKTEITKVEQVKETEIVVTPGPPGEIVVTTDEPKKTCDDCKHPKLLKEFYKDVKQKDGFVKICKDCWKIRYPHPKPKPHTALVDKQPKTTKNKVISTPVDYRYALTDEDLDVLLKPLYPQLEDAKRHLEYATAEVERIESLIAKLKRRKRNKTEVETEE